jgi:hypothetical protein
MSRYPCPQGAVEWQVLIAAYPVVGVTAIVTERCGGTVSSVGKFITRLRPGDTALQDQIFAEAHRLYETRTPLAEAISRLIEIAGDNPNAFRGFTKKNTKGLNRTPEGQAILRLVGTASAERDASHRTGVPLTGGRHSPEEESLAAMPVADAFNLLSKGEPTLLDADTSARRLAVDHRDDGDGGTALQEALGELVARVISTDRLVGKKSESDGSLLATNAAVMVVMEHLSASAGVDTNPYRTAAGSWWPPGD